ncbi:MAG: hypothetical protein GY714_12370 [Desulfobacterales bacterium]|nr:hypothetical protein [Desulfobacterales bacterium]
MLKAPEQKAPEQIPKEATILTAGIDMYNDRFLFVVRAWSKDKSWLIQYGSISTWKDLKRFIFNFHYPIQGTSKTMKISRAALNTTYRTEEVYDWLINNSKGIVYGICLACQPQRERIKSVFIHKIYSNQSLELKFLDPGSIEDRSRKEIGASPDHFIGCEVYATACIEKSWSSTNNSNFLKKIKSFLK